MHFHHGLVLYLPPEASDKSVSDKLAFLPAISNLYDYSITTALFLLFLLSVQGLHSLPEHFADT